MFVFLRHSKVDEDWVSDMTDQRLAQKKIYIGDKATESETVHGQNKSTEISVWDTVQKLL